MISQYTDGRYTPVHPLNNALWLASLGIPVFPIKPFKKSPYDNERVAKVGGFPVPADGGGGHRLATTDQNTIIRWWTDSYLKEAWIGIPTGAASGLYVLDIDRKNGKDGKVTLERKGLIIPPTVSTPTPSGGEHHYLKVPREGDQNWKTDADGLGEGLDRRGDGGYVAWYGPDLSQPLAEPPLWMRSDNRQSMSDIKPLGTMQGPSFVAVLAALTGIRPTKLSYGEWRNAVFAYRQAATGLATDEIIRACFDTWCEQYKKNNPATNNTLWNSATNGTIRGWSHLHWQAYGRPPAPDPVTLFGGRKYQLPTGASVTGLLSAQGPILAPLNKLLSSPTTPKWLIRRKVPAEAAGVLFGAPGTGKTFLAVDIAASVASGTPFNKHKTQQGPVVYLAGEGHAAIGTRFKAWFTERKIETGKEQIHISRTAVSFITSAPLEALVAEIDAMPVKPALVVIDTLFRATAGADVNDAQAMTQFWAAVDGIKERYGCTVLIVHHTGRQEQGRSFGSTVLLANADFEICLTRDETTKTAIVENTKQKDAEPFQQMQYCLKQVYLGHHVYPDDGEIEQITSCVCDFMEVVETANQDEETRKNVAVNAPKSPRAASQREVGALLCVIYDQVLKHKGIELTETVFENIKIPKKLIAINFVGSRHEVNNGLNGLGSTNKYQKKTWITVTEDGCYTPKAELLAWARDDNYDSYMSVELSDTDLSTIRQYR